MIVIHNDIGMTYGPRAYEKSVDRRNRLSIRDERYALGREQPNYPVPAIPVNVTNVLHSPIYITSRGRQTTVWLGATMIVAKWFNR